MTLVMCKLVQAPSKPSTCLHFKGSRVGRRAGQEVWISECVFVMCNSGLCVSKPTRYESYGVLETDVAKMCRVGETDSRLKTEFIKAWLDDWSPTQHATSKTFLFRYKVHPRPHKKTLACFHRVWRQSWPLFNFGSYNLYWGPKLIIPNQ